MACECAAALVAICMKDAPAKGQPAHSGPLILCHSVSDESRAAGRWVIKRRAPAHDTQASHIGPWMAFVYFFNLLPALFLCLSLTHSPDFDCTFFAHIFYVHFSFFFSCADAASVVSS